MFIKVTKGRLTAAFWLCLLSANLNFFMGIMHPESLVMFQVLGWTLFVVAVVLFFAKESIKEE